MFSDLVLLTCLASSLVMTGLIWFVQVVHYPIFAEVGVEAFSGYHHAHSRLTTYVVFGPMVIELITSILLVVGRPRGVGRTMVIIGLALAIGSWLSTGLIQVPSHNRLASSYQSEVQSWLVRSNWIRVVTWTGHSLALLMMTAVRMGWSAEPVGSN